MASRYPVVVVAGPTASGKTRLGVQLAREFSGEVLSCDALAVYRGMEIGTAKPTAQDRAAVPHHLIDLRDPTDEFSAGDFERLGREILGEVRRRDRLPFVVGGSGLYLRALEQGLFDGPARSEELRTRMRRIGARRGPGCLHRALARIDPAAAARIAPADLPRIMRAYEVYMQSGEPLSSWHARPSARTEEFRWLKLALDVDRAALYERIDARVGEMFERGFIEEVRGLLARFRADAPGFKAIGYRQIVRFLEGGATLEETIADTRRESRRYAKRQMTWLRADPSFVWLSGTEERRLEQARRAIRAFAEAR
jgi:tRNA dimethylallyltransferase